MRAAFSRRRCFFLIKVAVKVDVLYLCPPPPPSFIIGGEGEGWGSQGPHPSKTGDYGDFGDRNHT